MVKSISGWVLCLSLLLVACEKNSDPISPAVDTAADTGNNNAVAMNLNFAKTFSAVQQDGMWIIDLKASIATWGSEATGPEQRARILLVPKDRPVPTMEGEFADAQLIRIPVERIAVNLAPFEAMLTALEEDNRLVAVGGPKSYNDSIRKRVLAGEIAQIGYGWHIPPILDALLAAEPDLLLMAMGDLSHSSQMARIRDLGVPVLPMFINSEPHYMGKVEYIRLLGLLTGQDQAAEQFVAMVAEKVDALKTAAAAQASKNVISAWYSGSGRWMATVRNSEAALLRDANGQNLLAEPDDPRRDEFQKLATEQLIIRGADADCAILRDSHSQVFRDRKTLEQFRAFRNGCVFAIDGMNKLQADAYDYYEGAVIRPDRVLRDLVHMLHPQLRDDTSFMYIQPDKPFYD
ncbi:Uncharacterised protein [Zhongshania aliphaticivorans]|uniref:Fe/B12 periplasmic-binding domain-containing protein n=1 Tax=Zhongshania aliphaticivorans TaxID=1470434 RepID=A0A5S9N6K7_9GAMM|nr:ABC transporter substrate-binding protein [Zhongshania aliphaticivorans]CAA0080734.1 Uncharacterised protein [Zhongshania aliphaticivorans]CAA0085539.1 Uncharacterised protein [Zhongshania aliphaticivorans]